MAGNPTGSGPLLLLEFGKGGRKKRAKKMPGSPEWEKRGEGRSIPPGD